MKKLIFLFLILFAFPASAQEWREARMNVAIISGSVEEAAVNTDSCTGGLLFSWHCENVDVTLGGVGRGVNNGCSAGDTTATVNRTAAINNDHTAQDGSYHCDFPSTYDR